MLSDRASYTAGAGAGARTRCWKASALPARRRCWDAKTVSWSSRRRFIMNSYSWELRDLGKQRPLTQIQDLVVVVCEGTYASIFFFTFVWQRWFHILWPHNHPQLLAALGGTQRSTTRVCIDLLTCDSSCGRSIFVIAKGSSLNQLRVEISVCHCVH